MGTIRAFLEAVTALCNFLVKWWPLHHLHQLEKELHEIDLEIIAVGVDPSPVDQLRLEVLAREKARVGERIRSLRSSIPNAD